MKTTPWKVENKKLNLGNRSISMLSGEVHYWRLDPHQWRPVLERVRELGIRLVASYICWDFHETSPGEFDFTGRTDPRRNLVGFIELLTEMGFDIVLRPGPYIYAEWKNNGVPDRVAHLHRLDPLFLTESSKYMQAVVEVIQPYFHTRGGKVVLLQADNEIDLWQALFTEKIGIGKARGSFTDFIHQEYSTADDYNLIHHTHFADLDQIRPVCMDVPDRPELFSQYLVYLRFKHWYTDAVAKWAVETYRQLGVDIPIYLNGYDGLGVQNWVHFGKIGDLYGLDTYPTNELTRWPDEFRFLLEKGRYSRAISKLPYLAEFESGIWHGWHYDTLALTPNHYRFTSLSALLAGFAGWNWYMLVNRDNWYMAPINEWGRTRPELFEVFKQIVEIYERVAPPTLEHLSRLFVSADPTQRAVVKTNEKFMKALFSTRIDFEFFDLEVGECSQPLVFYSGREWLGAESQKKLLQYVNSGGHLVFFGVVPTLDDTFQPTHFFKKPEPSGLLPKINTFEVTIAGHTFKAEMPWMEWFSQVEGSPITVIRVPPEGITAEELLLQHSLEVGQSYVIGYSINQGAGKITYIGADPSPELIGGVLKSAGIEPPVHASNPEWASALYRRDGKYYLFIVNPTDQNGTAVFELTADFGANTAWKIENLVSKTSEIVTSLDDKLSLSTNLSRKDALVLQITRLDQ
jgi:hypothetical protein